MEAVSSLSFSAVGYSSKRKVIGSFAACSLASGFDSFSIRAGFSCHYVGIKSSNSISNSSAFVKCMCTASATDVPTVSETKLNFLKAYRRPIPSIYSNVLQELIVQQHLMRYKRHIVMIQCLRSVLSLPNGRLMEGYPSDKDRDAIFRAYIKALEEDPEQYRGMGPVSDWKFELGSTEGDVEVILKDIAETAGNDGSFSYSRLFAVGLLCLLELANATEPTVLEKFCAALTIDKRSVDRDLDAYHNLLTKLVRAKEFLKEYVAREKKKREERTESQKATEANYKMHGGISIR